MKRCLSSMYCGSKLDYLHVSLVDFRSLPRRGADRSRARMELIKEAVQDRLPLIGAGQVHTPEDALQALETGADLIGIGRGLLMDPEWLQKFEPEKRTIFKQPCQDMISGSSQFQMPFGKVYRCILISAIDDSRLYRL